MCSCVAIDFQYFHLNKEVRELTNSLLEKLYNKELEGEREIKGGEKEMKNQF